LYVGELRREDTGAPVVGARAEFRRTGGIATVETCAVALAMAGGRPEYLPVLVAAFTSIALVGVVLNWVVFGLALAVLLFCIVRWVRDVRRDVADLPLEH